MDWLIENGLSLDDLKDEVDMDNDVVQKALIRMAVRTGVDALRRREASSCKWMQELDREKQGPSYVALAQAIWAQQPASEVLAWRGITHRAVAVNISTRSWLWNCIWHDHFNSLMLLSSKLI